MKFRKKPVVIEAFQFNVDPWPDWAWEKVTTNDITFWDMGSSSATGQIKTLEGDMFAHHGDYIIKGVKGEIYPCKPDIFKATYEKVEGE